MAKLFPSKQQWVDQHNGTQVLVSKVKILTTGSDHLELPNAVDAALLQAARTTADPTFYLIQDRTQIAIDGATVGTEYTVVSSHTVGINYYRGDATSDNPK